MYSNKISLSKEQRKNYLGKLQDYFEREFSYDLKNLEGEIFLDFLIENISPVFYNKGIEDSMVYLNEKKDEMFLLMKDE